MANVNLSGLKQTFFLTNLYVTFKLGNVEELSSTGFSYISASNSEIDLVGSGFTYSNSGVPTGGIVSEFRLDIGANDSDAAADLRITGLSFNLSRLAKLTDGTLSEENENNLLWRTVLGGDDTISFGSATAALIGSFAGDGRGPGIGTGVNGGADSFVGLMAGAQIAGDFRFIREAEKVLGGDDLFDVTGSGDIDGDVGIVSGHLFGGDDTIVAVGTGTGLEIRGDASNNLSVASIVGGDDVIRLDGIGRVYGDAGFINDWLVGGNDTITVTGSAANRLFGDVGLVNGARMLGGDDTIRGGGGNDEIWGDWSSLLGNADTSGGEDRLYGEAGADELHGNGGDDLLDGGEDDDQLHGEAGDDRIVGGAGVDTAWITDFAGTTFRRLADGTVIATGGEGTDTISGVESFRFTEGTYDLAGIDRNAPVVAKPIAGQTVAEDGLWTFQLPADAFTDADGDELTFSASLQSGAALPAWLAFDAATRSFSGKPPLNDDTGLALRVTASDGIKSASAAFALDITPVNDAPVITSGKGAEKLSLGLAENKAAVTAVKAADLDGGALTFSILGGADAKLFKIDGKTGALSFKAKPDFEMPADKGKDNLYGVTVAVSDGKATDTQQITIQIKDVAGVAKTGTAKANTLKGGSEADTLKGLGGNDRLVGGGGADKLYGGAGADLFAFAFLADSTVGAKGRDTILDFGAGDRIDVSFIDANGKAPGSPLFTFIGAQAFHGKAGELRAVTTDGGTDIFGDTNGDKKADFSVYVDDAVKLAKADFLL